MFEVMRDLILLEWTSNHSSRRIQDRRKGEEEGQGRGAEGGWSSSWFWPSWETGREGGTWGSRRRSEWGHGLSLWRGVGCPIR